ncbi:DEAD/DEAH box helicase [Candidatus Micrarchaeota archaeon]|nr:DEAD/DEAH box helicase [Candidatus Micrarchaeota archaeon]
MKFKEMGISGRTIGALKLMEYEDSTEVQEKAIPLILQGEDLMVRSQTGTGKTAAFGIGLIELLSKDRSKKGLILAPTRELASQICDELRSIAKNHRIGVFAVYGGQSMGRQISALRKGVDILVATPGRLLDHMRQRTVRLESINCIVLDEADRMLDMGFKPDIDKILGSTSSQKQVLLFSATLDSNIHKIARDYMQMPRTVEIGNAGKVERIDEKFIRLSRAEKFDRLKNILLQNPDAKKLVFLRSKRSVEHICRKLKKAGVEVQFLHGGKSQNQREKTVRGFQEGSFRILIATDVAARGLHIDDVSHVINYDQADSDDMHTHRIGRTARNGNDGSAITFIETDPLPKKGRYAVTKRRGSFQSFRHRKPFAY